MKQGSFTFCNEFINAATSSDTLGVKKTFEQLLHESTGTPSTEPLPAKVQSFLSRVRFIYKYIKDTVSEEVITAIMDTALPDSGDEDRSDILVFLVLLAILSGDSRNVILEWWNLYDPDVAVEEDLKFISKIASYDWLSVLTSSAELVAAQRKALKVAAEINRYKGTLDSFITCIKNNTFDMSGTTDVDVSAIEIYESDEFLPQDGHAIVVNSPYTRFPRAGESDPDNYFRYLSMSIYQKALLDKLEELRPAGVFIYYVVGDHVLEPFEYFNRVYSDGRHPAKDLATSISSTGVYTWSSIVKYIKLYFDGSERSYSDAYEQNILPMSMYMIVVLYLSELDMQTIVPVFGLDGQNHDCYYSTLPEVSLPVDYRETTNGADEGDTGTIDGIDEEIIPVNE